MDGLFKLARAGKCKRNACRNLHRLINSSNQSLPVPIDATQVRVLLRRPFLRKVKLWWPILRMTDWVEALIRKRPQVLLAGCQVEETAKWKGILKAFWENYRGVNADHPIFSSTLPLECAVPYFFHGDEGRGLRNRPIMVEAFQPVISQQGPGVTNESGHSSSMRSASVWVFSLPFKHL